MYARAVDESASRLRELRDEERNGLGLGALALALSLVATSLRPELALPLFIGGIAVGALGVRAVWHRWVIVDSLVGERDAYVISEIRERAVHEATMERRRVLAAALRSWLTEPMSDRVRAAAEELQALAAELEDDRLVLEPAVRGRLQSTPERSRAKPAHKPGIPRGGSALGCPPDPVRLRVPSARRLTRATPGPTGSRASGYAAGREEPAAAAACPLRATPLTSAAAATAEATAGATRSSKTLATT